MTHDQPITTAGLQAKVQLRRAWFEAHPNQPIPEGRAQVERLFAAIEAEAAAPTDPPESGHQPGDFHRYRIECEVCGWRGQVQLSVEPQRFEEPPPLSFAGDGA